jgi:Flp pilus assembly protein TadD
VQQAVEDYSRALLLNPSDEKVYYLRGLCFRRLGMDREAMADLKAASDLRYRPAHDFLKSIGVFS